MYQTQNVSDCGSVCVVHTSSQMCLMEEEVEEVTYSSFDATCFGGKARVAKVPAFAEVCNKADAHMQVLRPIELARSSPEDTCDFFRFYTNSPLALLSNICHGLHHTHPQATRQSSSLFRPTRAS